jgi:hypothetical protein
MKDIRPAIRSILLADTNVSTMVGGLRIFPMTMPQGIIDPSVVYHRITEVGDYSMEGDTGLLLARLQIDSWGQKADLASQLAGFVHDVLSGFRGIDGTVNIQGIFLLTGREDFDSVAKMYRVSRDYETWYS